MGFRKRLELLKLLTKMWTLFTAVADTERDADVIGQYIEAKDQAARLLAQEAAEDLIQTSVQADADA